MFDDDVVDRVNIKTERRHTMATTTMRRKPQQPGIKQLRVMTRELSKKAWKVHYDSEKLYNDTVYLYNAVMALDVRGGENKAKRKRHSSPTQQLARRAKKAVPDGIGRRR
jgi:hypothetical protein